MPVELYETMFVLDSGKMATDGDMIKGSLHTTLEKHGGTVLVSRPWNENQKLAYPMRKQKKAYFHIIYYKMESTHQKAFEADMRLNMTDFLLRHLTSNVDYRYEEVMLHIAKDEQGGSFALRGYQDEPSPTDITPANINDPNAPPPMDFGPVPDLNGGPVGPVPARRPRRSETADADKE